MKSCLYYVILLLAMILICVLMCARIDAVCGSVEEIRIAQEEVLDHLDAIDEFIIDVADRETVDPLESIGEFTLTWYCAEECCCGSYANGLTATGTPATPGRTIAVDPAVIPYGTHVVIAGHEYVAEDCGGAIRGNRIDILAESHAAALQNGRQTAEVFIVR